MAKSIDLVTYQGLALTIVVDAVESIAECPQGNSEVLDVGSRADGPLWKLTMRSGTQYGLPTDEALKVKAELEKD